MASAGPAVVTGPQDDHGLHHRAALRVRGCDRRGLGDGGVPDQRRLHLERADPVAGREDHVVQRGPRTTGSRHRRAARGRLFATPDRANGRLAEVAAKERRDGGRVERQLALGRGPALLVDHVEPEARQRPAHRSRAHRLTRRHAGQLAGLRLAVTVMDVEPHGLAKDPDHLRIEGLPRGNQPSQRRMRLRRERCPLGDHPVLGRGLAQHGDAVLGGHREPLRGLEAGIVQQRGGAPRPRRHERVASRFRPAAGRGAPGKLSGTRAEPVLGLCRLAAQVAPASARRARGSPAVPDVKIKSAGSRGARVGRLARGLGVGEAVGVHVVPPGRILRRPRAPPAAPSCRARRRAPEPVLPARSAGRCPWRAAARSRVGRRRPAATRASSPKTHSGRAPMSVITTSPRPDSEPGQARRRRRGLGRRLLERVGAHGPVRPRPPGAPRRRAARGRAARARRG